MTSMTLTGAAQLLGVTPKTLKNRADRGKLATELDGNVRKVTLQTLREAGFEVAAVAAPTQAEAGKPTSATSATSTAQDLGPVSDLIAGLVAENGRLHRENGTLTARLTSQLVLTERVESSRQDAQGQLVEARARISELEARLAAAPTRRRWPWSRRSLRS